MEERCVHMTGTARSIDRAAQACELLHLAGREEVPRWIADLVVDLAARLGLDVPIPETPMEAELSGEEARAARPLRTTHLRRYLRASRSSPPALDHRWTTTWRVRSAGRVPDHTAVQVRSFRATGAARSLAPHAAAADWVRHVADDPPYGVEAGRVP